MAANNSPRLQDLGNPRTESRGKQSRTNKLKRGIKLGKRITRTVCSKKKRPDSGDFEGPKEEGKKEWNRSS